MTLPGPFCVRSRTFNSPSGELTTQVVSAFALAMVASVNAAARKICFTLVLHFFGGLISAACPKRARPGTGDLPCSCIPPLSRFARRAGFAARRQTFVHRGQNCGVGLRLSGGWQVRRATALRL